VKRLLSITLTIITALTISGCPKPEPPGVVKDLIEQYRGIKHPIYYFETHGEMTTVYRILENTRDTNAIVTDLDGVIDMKSSFTSVFLLRQSRDGYLYVTRLENDRAMTHDAVPDLEFSSDNYPIWAVSGTDTTFVCGIDSDGVTHVIGIDWSRREAEQTFRENEVLEPTISYEIREWYSTRDMIWDIDVAPDGNRIAIMKSLPDTPGSYGLFFIDGPAGTPVRIGDNPVFELGGFSPDNQWYLAAFHQTERVDIFLIDNGTLEAEPVTHVAHGFITGHPAWHPNSRYFIYTTNYTTDMMQSSQSLSGEQLFLYSIDSMNDRRLTAFNGVTMWVDFSPMGDFLLYSSTPGVMSRLGYGTVDEDQQQAYIDAGYETWRMYYVPWDPEEFQTGNIRILTPDESRFLIGWTHGGNEIIKFSWGPGEPDAL